MKIKTTHYGVFRKQIRITQVFTINVNSIPFSIRVKEINEIKNFLLFHILDGKEIVRKIKITTFFVNFT
jgi:hypothetical protein